MYSFPDFEPVYCSMSSSNCCFLTCIQRKRLLWGIGPCDYGYWEDNDLPSTSWRPSKVVSKLSEPEGSRIRSTDIEGQEKMDVSAQAEKAISSFLHILVLFRPSANWMMHLNWGGWVFLTQFISSNANLFLTGAPRNNALWASLSPVNLTCKTSHDTVPPFSFHLWCQLLPRACHIESSQF